MIKYLGKGKKILGMKRRLYLFCAAVALCLVGSAARAAPAVDGGGGTFTAVGNVVQNAGLINFTSIIVTADDDLGVPANSANFNNTLGGPVNGLEFEARDYISIAGDLWNNNGAVPNNSGGFGIIGDNSSVTTRMLSVGGDFVMGGGAADNMALNVNSVNIGGNLATNSGSRLSVNPSDYANAPAMAVSGAMQVAGGMTMGAAPMGGESVFIAASAPTDTYTITAGSFATNGPVAAGTGNLIINSADINFAGASGNVTGNAYLNAGNAGNVNIGGNLGTGVSVAAKNLTVGGDVENGVRLSLNPANADGGPASFDRMNINVGGIYYFDNNSFLQLVLNQDIAGPDGVYDPYADAALINVGGFDASGVTVAQNMGDVTSAPNIEIIVDGLMQQPTQIKVLQSNTPIADMGALTLAGVWLHDSARGANLFQEGTFSVEGDALYLNIATARSIADLVAHVPPAAGPTGNDMQMARAIDDLIAARAGGDISGKYSSLLRLLFPDGDIYNKMMVNGGANLDALFVMTRDMPGNETEQTYIRAMNYVRQFAPDNTERISRSAEISGRIIRDDVSDHLLDDFIWQRYHNRGVLWGQILLNSPGGGGTILSAIGGVDYQFGKSWMAGLNLGYNHLNFNSVSGHGFNFGAYGTVDAASWARAYAKADLTVHYLNAEETSPLAGPLKSSVSTVDETLELGLLHRLFNTYLTGRAYAYAGNIGGYAFTKKANGRNFMDIKSGNSFVLTPGYEISLGKDIFMGNWSFVRPSLKFGLEYDLLPRDRDFQFKFSESPAYRDWQIDKGYSRLWLRYGGQVEFAVSAGANVILGYQILRNSDFKTHQFKLAGSIRF